MKSTINFVKFDDEYKLSSEMYFCDSNIRIGKNVYIGSGTLIRANTVICDDVEIGEKCVIGNSVLIREQVIICDNVKIGFCNVIEPYAKIGEGTSTQGFAMFSEYGRVGRNCFIGPHFNSMGDNTIGKPKGKYKANPPSIGSNCRFGSATKIVPGVKVANGTVTGAMTLITKDTEKNSLYVGIPAKLIKKLNGELKIK